jgi:hypothetical protein
MDPAANGSSAAGMDVVMGSIVAVVYLAHVGIITAV